MPATTTHTHVYMNTLDSLPHMESSGSDLVTRSGSVDSPMDLPISVPSASNAATAKIYFLFLCRPDTVKTVFSLYGTCM